MTSDQIQTELSAIDAAIESELVHRYQAYPTLVGAKLQTKLFNIRKYADQLFDEYQNKILRATQDCVDKMNETL